MKKNAFLFALALLVGWIMYSLFSDFDHTNDAIYYGGDIVTMADTTKKVEAVQVKNGKIIATGSKIAILQLKSSTTRLIDLQGKTLLPGFFDAHGHLDLATIFYDMTNISGFTRKTPEAVWKIVSEKIKNTPKGQWIFFNGLDPILTKGVLPPNMRFLDSIAPEHPIAIITQATHAFYANSKAFATLGIDENTPNPSKYSYYEHDSNGKLTGLIAEPLAFEPFRLQLQAQITASFGKNTQKIMLDNAKNGVTSTVTMGLLAVKKNILMLYEHLSAEKPKPFTNFLAAIGKLPARQPNLRHFIYLKHQDTTFLPQKIANGDDFFKIMGVKCWYDGSPYIGSMYLRQPYIQSNFTIHGIHLTPSHQGESLFKPDDFSALIEKYQTKGWQIAVHAQGDKAIEEVIAAYQLLHQKSNITAYRHRLEHCLLLPPSVMGAMKTMNITPSFHINHLLYYGDFLKSDILGDERAEKVLPLKAFSEQNTPFSLHADQPMYEANPLSLMSTAVNRTTASGTLINPKEKISVWQALKSVTIDAAWQLHLEEKLGTIEQGKYADFVILDKNPLKIVPESLASLKVLETIVAGNTVWKAGK
jgi:predicted amidohydrolase YtcJ